MAKGRNEVSLKKKGRPPRRTPLQENLVMNGSHYQFSLRANWKVRGLSAAVGCPAVQVTEIGSQSGLTSATLKWFNILNPSAITSRFRRSVTANLRARRKSIWKKPGRVKALRPSVPVHPNGGEGT